MTTLIDRQFAFNLWANSEIIKLCESLDEEQLTVEIPGVFGRIQPTIAHIVRSEGNYLRDLGGNAPWPDEVEWDKLTLTQLSEMAHESGTALRKIADSIDPDTRCEFIEENEQHVFPAWTVINQAINHGIEHRTQLRLLLTKLDVTHPGQSVWGFAESIGALQIHNVAQE
jgi:uncharacterized damage-inducible protein DinB